MADKNFDQIAAIHFRNLEESDPSTNANPELVKELRNLGVDTVLVPNRDAYNLNDSNDSAADSSVEAHPIRLEKTTNDQYEIRKEAAEEYTLGSRGISAVRTRVYVPPGAVEEIIPVINGQRMRRIGSSKWLQYQLFKDYFPQTILLKPDEDVNDLPLEELRTQLVAVKGDSTFQSRYLEITDKREIKNAIASIREKQKDYEKNMGSQKRT